MKKQMFTGRAGKMGLVPAAVAVALVSLSGCATSKQVRQVDRDASPVVQSRYSTATTVLQDDAFRVDNGFYASTRPIISAQINPSKQLPAAFRKDASMNIQSARTLTDLASLIASKSGHQIAIDQDVLDVKGSSGSGGVTSVAQQVSLQSMAPPVVVQPGAGMSELAPTALPPLPGGAVPVSVGAPVPLPALASNDLMISDIIYKGDLGGLLDMVTSKLGLSWRWTGQRVEIFRYETKMFRLNALAGTTDTSSNLNTTSSSLSGGGGGMSGGGSSGGGNQGSSGSNTSTSTQMDIWPDVEKAIQNVLSSNGKVSMTPSAGVITVRDTPQNLSQVETMIGELNKIYGKQVRINVEVYALERNASDSAAVDWNIVWSSAGSRMGFNVGTGGSAAGSANAFSLTSRSGPFSGSGVVASVLSSLGKTTLLTSAPFQTLNGQTVPVNTSSDQAYVAQYSTTLGGGTTGGSTTTITPGVVSEGFSMNVTPRILEDGNVMIRYAIDLSTIDGIQEFVSPDKQSAIQLPRRSVKNFLQNVKVKSGETLVLTGFQQVTSATDSSGPGSFNAWALGGSKKASLKTRTLVVVITPYILK